MEQPLRDGGSYVLLDNHRHVIAPLPYCDVSSLAAMAGEHAVRIIKPSTVFEQQPHLVLARDRLSEPAQREHTTLATVITKLLDAADEQAFWTAVCDAHAVMSDEDRAAFVPDATLGDDLADEADDALSAEDAW